MYALIYRLAYLWRKFAVLLKANCLFQLRKIYRLRVGAFIVAETYTVIIRFIVPAFFVRFLWSTVCFHKSNVIFPVFIIPELFNFPHWSFDSFDLEFIPIKLMLFPPYSLFLDYSFTFICRRKSSVFWPYLYICQGF